MAIIEDFWGRVLASVMWFFAFIAWPFLLIGATYLTVGFIANLIHKYL